MTEKEKEKQVVSQANQLISLHSLAILSEIGNKLTISEVKQIAKQCALVTVDKTLRAAFYAKDDIYDYYMEIKQEIEKL
jgi:hypothetical protein